jgi:hypothetical protein
MLNHCAELVSVSLSASVSNIYLKILIPIYATDPDSPTGGQGGTGFAKASNLKSSNY